jgi:lysophospholipase L1-like esterase
MRTLLVARVSIALASLFAAATAQGQLVPEVQLPKANCCLQGAAQQLADQLQDWNQLGRYHQDDERLKSQSAQAGRVVFMGDSITDGWTLAGFFPGKPYVNRGIGGQTTPQMLVRMFPDVIDLHPAAVIILAGTNDIGGNTGPETSTMVEQNLQAMTELAQKHDIKVILCSVLPVSDYTQHKQTAKRPPADILKINAWIKQYVGEAQAGFADYYGALVDAQEMLKDGYSNDGLHPNAKGYALLAPVAEAAIEKALK